LRHRVHTQAFNAGLESPVAHSISIGTTAAATTADDADSSTIVEATVRNDSNSDTAVADSAGSSSIGISSDGTHAATGELSSAAGTTEHAGSCVACSGVLKVIFD
jgi:Flp pilus assembly protein TadD